MGRKLLSDAAASKLVRQQEEGVETPRVMPRRKVEKLPKSLRLTTVDNERLRRLSERLGETADRTISETEAIKGLLLLGEKTDPKKLLAYVKYTVFESN